jgi:hypothetical protein
VSEELAGTDAWAGTVVEVVVDVAAGAELELVMLVTAVLLVAWFATCVVLVPAWDAER